MSEKLYKNKIKLILSVPWIGKFLLWNGHYEKRGGEMEQIHVFLTFCVMLDFFDQLPDLKFRPARYECLVKSIRIFQCEPMPIIARNTGHYTYVEVMFDGNKPIKLFHSSYNSGGNGKMWRLSLEETRYGWHRYRFTDSSVEVW